ncbi:MAG: NBR1-Ig-like domain-containing protein, partial [Anaerolineae bacterium]
MKAKPFILILMLLMFASAGCGGTEPEPTETPPPPTDAPPSEPVTGMANVESIQILMLESFPVQVNARLRGVLPDGCTTIDQINTEKSGNDFTITMTTFRPADAVCTEATVPFDEVVALDVLGLDAGTYNVTANGVSGTFTLAVDNRIMSEIVVEDTPTPEPVDPNSASISGIVWHDLCAVAAGAEEGQLLPSEGCIATADGSSFQANGLLEDGEPGLQDVVVSLGEGECPAEGLATAVTDADGNYTFADLAAGVYCVSIDALNAPNDALLLPGGWTQPESGEALTTITVGAGEAVSGVNFGWDFEFLPVAEVDQATCTRSIGFEEDLTVPDDTVFAPGQEFVKSWRLRNTGTCPWIEGYSLVFVNGDQMGSPDTQPLPKIVAPGQTVDVSVNLTAPEEPGEYLGRWQISDANGDLFGVGGFIEETIYTRIQVEVPGPTPEPNSGVIGGVIWEDVCFIQDDGTPSRGCVETEEGSGFYVADGTLNFNEGRLSDIEVSLSPGACPEDGVVPASSVIATATTGPDGLYRFEGLDSGLYCVSVDAFSDANVNLLIPGDWTWPFPGVGMVGINLD